jgi:hypothetical protein
MTRLVTFSIAALVAALTGVIVEGQARGQGTPARGCDLPEPFPCPVARILDMTVEPATINPGESATITWAAENPTNMTLSPGIGRVLARGTRRVTPSATTTFTLRTEGGPDGQVVTRSVTLAVRGTQPVRVETEASGPRPTPRMPDGKPDLQGVYIGGGVFVGGFTGGSRGVSVWPAPDGLPTPPTPRPGGGAVRRVDAPDEVGGGCGVESVPVYLGPSYHFQFVQTPRQIVMLIQRMHLYRIIEMDVDHPADVLNGERTSYLGYSVGRWEGDTLVVDTRGFNDKVWAGANNGSFTGGYTHKNLRMIERIRRIDYDTIEFDVRLEDAEYFLSPWRSISRHPLRPEFTRLEEYICDQLPDAYKPLLQGLPPARQPAAQPPPPAQPNQR